MRRNRLWIVIWLLRQDYTRHTLRLLRTSARCTPGIQGCEKLSFTFTMCRTEQWRAQCGHSWITLKRPCADGRDLLSCPDFSSGQPCGAATIPALHCTPLPRSKCPRCGLQGNYDMRYTRIARLTRVGWRIGYGPERDAPGCDIYLCTVM